MKVVPFSGRRSATEKKPDAERRLLLATNNVPLPVRFEPRTVTGAPDDPGLEAWDCSNGVYLVPSKGGRIKYKVEKRKTKWTCTCPAWRSKRRTNCEHIRRAIPSLSEDPYSTARRRARAEIIYAAGELKYNTRLIHAGQDSPRRVPLIFAELCALICEEPPRIGRGAPPIPLAVRAYAILTKCYFRLSYDELAVRLDGDGAVETLGWKKGRPISRNALCSVAADRRLLAVFQTMLETTARPARNIETVAAIDASGLSTIMVANYLDAKHRKVKQRKGSSFLKVHWCVGIRTNLVASVHFTMNGGVGSADAPHYGLLARKALRSFTKLDMIVGDGSYGNIGNSARSEAYGIKLISQQRSHEDRSKWGGQAAEVARMEEDDPDAFDEIYRHRSKAETAPSRTKRRNPFQLLRRRATDVGVVTATTGNDAGLCDLPDSVLDLILERALSVPGRAQLNEAFAMVVGGNARALVTLEHLHDDRVRFHGDMTFQPIPTVRESDLRVVS